MSRPITLQVDSLDYFQIEAALQSKIASWRLTERWLQAEKSHDTNLLNTLEGSIEECSDVEEAAAIAEQYEIILATLAKQYREQTP